MACTVPLGDLPLFPTFSTTCSVNYCLTTPAMPTWTWTGSSGDVTRSEFESALEVAYAQTAITQTKNGNELAYGPAAFGAWGASLLYDMSGDKRALDLMVRWADNVLALRNDNQTGQVLWNGKRELVWPTTKLTAEVQGAGSEQGMIIGHMVTAAVYILKTLCVHNLVPPVHAGYPTPFPESTTYYERALRYIQAGDETYDTYLIPNFAYETDLIFCQPNDRRWNLGGKAANPAGKIMVWNRRMLLIHGLLSLANAHGLLPTPDVTHIIQEDSIIRANMLDFLGNLNSTTSTKGTPTYAWYYPPAIEGAASGLHGLWDIWVTFMAWQRDPILFGTTPTVMKTLANTMADTIYRSSDNMFSAFVDGRVTTSDSPRLQGIWAFYSHWREDWYDIVATTSAKAGLQNTDYALLWVKHALFIQSPSFWNGEAQMKRARQVITFVAEDTIANAALRGSAWHA